MREEGPRTRVTTFLLPQRPVSSGERSNAAWALLPSPSHHGQASPVLCDTRRLVTQCQDSLDTESTTDRESLLRTKALSGSHLFLKTKMYPDPQPWAASPDRIQ